eukprot:jgi/Hompol1/1479/HPOL_005601-RA
MTSKAVILNQFGIDNLQVVSRPVPVPGDGEVLVNIKLRPVNPSDVLSVLGYYLGFKPKSFPATPGLEGYGVIQQVGAGVTAGKVKVGQRVVPFANGKDGHGTWQEHIVVSQHAPVPDNVSDESAAQFIVNPLTVMNLIRLANVPAGEFLVQDAAGSVLGRMIIQVAKLHSIKTVNIVRRAAQINELKALGADFVISTEDLDTPEKISAKILEVTGGVKPYSAISAVGGAAIIPLTLSIRDGGLIQVYGALDNRIGQIDLSNVISRVIRISGFSLSPALASLTETQRNEMFTETFSLMAKGVLTPLAGEKFAIEDVIKAVHRSQEAARGGKVLIATP